jgi:hypothetical protein
VENARLQEPRCIGPTGSIDRDTVSSNPARAAHGRTTTMTYSTATGTSAASCGRTRRHQIAAGSGPSQRGCRKAPMIAVIRRRARMRWQISRWRGNARPLTSPLLDCINQCVGRKRFVQICVAACFNRFDLILPNINSCHHNNIERTS